MNDYEPNYIHQKSYAIVGQKAIITNDQNQILILQRSEKSGNGGKWSLVGGALEYGEDPIEGIKREIKEEVQIEVTKPRPFHLFSIVNKNEDFVLMIGYGCIASSQEVILNWEHDSFKWVSIKEALELDLSQHARIFIEYFEKVSTNLHQDNKKVA